MHKSKPPRNQHENNEEISEQHPEWEECWHVEQTAISADGLIAEAGATQKPANRTPMTKFLIWIKTRPTAHATSKLRKEEGIESDTDTISFDLQANTIPTHSQECRWSLQRVDPFPKQTRDHSADLSRSWQGYARSSAARGVVYRSKQLNRDAMLPT